MRRERSDGEEEIDDVRPSLHDHIQDERAQERIRRATAAAEADYVQEDSAVVPIEELVDLPPSPHVDDNPLNVKPVSCRRRNCGHTVSYHNNSNGSCIKHFAFFDRSSSIITLSPRSGIKL